MLDPSHRLATRNRSFSVLREDGSELIAIPHGRIGRIEIGPGVDFTRSPLDLALDAGIELALVDGHGQTRGTVGDAGGRRASTQFAQAATVLDPPLRLEFARRLVEARIRNQRTQLMRLNRTRSIAEVETVLESLLRSLRKLPACTNIEEVLGVEGAGTAGYWPALAALLDEPPPLPFRRTRPAADAVNAAINYLTGILERDIRAAIQDAALHPGFAFLHASRDRHDGLVYDLMEPFRAPLTEGLAVYLFNARRLKADMFRQGQEWPIEMTAEARQAVVAGYETAVARRVNRPDGGGKLGWRAMMRHQAQGLAQAVRDRRPEAFQPYLMEA